MELLQLLVDSSTWTVKPAVDAFTRNLSLTFLAVPRPGTAAALPYLVVLWGDAYRKVAPSQARPIAHLLLRCLVGLTAENNTDNNNNEAVQEHLNTARRLCQQDSMGAALYSLLLDVLLYTTTTKNNATTSSTSLPPPGLSADGAEVLRTGPSAVAKD